MFILTTNYTNLTNYSEKSMTRSTFCATNDTNFAIWVEEFVKFVAACGFEKYNSSPNGFRLIRLIRCFK